MQRIPVSPFPWPLILVGSDSFFECAPIMTTSVKHTCLSADILPNLICHAQHSISHLLTSSTGVYILHRLLPIQYQRQDCAEQALNLGTRYSIHHASLNVLRSEMGGLAGECFLKTRSEHYDELLANVSGRVLEVAHAS